MTKKPNLLFLLSDQHRFCDLGCYGNQQVQTPVLDTMAEEGVQLERFYSNCPLCVPARGTLLTGRYPLKHGAVANDLPINPEVPSIADALNQNGYQTAYVGKWHLGGISRDKAIPKKERLGFQYWRACNCNHDYYHAWYDDDANTRHEIEGYEPIAQTELAMEFLQQANAETPWALFVCYGTPHEPYHLVPQEALDAYERKQPVFRENVQLPACLSPERLVDERMLQDWYKGYYAHISQLDAQIGRLLGFLKERGERENTIVVYTSDHGDMLGSHGLTNKQWPHEESVHVPFLLSYGNRFPKGKRDQLMSLVDVTPTLLGMLGIEGIPGMDGEDLHSVFEDETAQGKEAVYLFDYIPCHQAYDRNSREWRAIRTERFTFAKTPYQEAWLLFDNQADPLQKRNLVENPVYQGVMETLNSQLERLIIRHDSLLPFEQFIVRFGLKEKWNESQAYFHYPLLP